MKCKNTVNVKQQIDEGISRFTKDIGDKFVIYFQAYTNTYGNLEYLRTIWLQALEHEDVVGISIATRPDCLGEDVLQLLSEIRNEYENRKFIWIELGLQTIHERTAEYIRRHYSLSVYREAVLNLNRINIPYITHIILGLPGETKEDMLKTVAYVERGVFDETIQCYIRPFGIKLQLLHVLRHTDLALDYKQGKFQTMEMDEYVELVIEALQIIHPDIVIHRVTGDGPKALLISPTWSSNKKLVLNTLHKKMAQSKVTQGENIKIL